MKNLIDTKQIKNVKLYIVGQPESDKLELTTLINNLEIKEYIQLEGIKNNVSQYLLASDIFILPSRSEGISLSLMEACAAGLPIIASNVGGIPEVAKENINSILFESENIQQLGECIVRLTKDRNLRLKLGEQSKKIYEEYFSTQTNVAKLIKYYNLD
jgi:glycosyltransferase involved in cell wall biosynthesis